ncbi:MAG: D-amino-acid transaminase [Hyphomicrobiales bacterium]
MGRTVYVDGAYVDEAEAKVSIFDRGYLFADGVYEVTSVLGGKLIDAEPHFQRLDRSLRELEIAWPCTMDELIGIHHELIRRNDIDQGGVYMQITRGVADRDFTYPGDVPSVLTAFTQTRNLIDHPKAATGVKVVSMPDIRWRRRDIKSIALLAQAMCKQAAAEQGAYEGWMIEDGHVTEGTSSTSYIVKDDTVITRPISNSILAGVTRRTVLRLMAERAIGLDERAFSIEEAYDADEAFMTSASSFVLPIVEIDGRQIGGGQPGPVARRLREIYIEEAQKTAI